MAGVVDPLHADALLFDYVLDEAGSEPRGAEIKARLEGVDEACLTYVGAACDLHQAKILSKLHGGTGGTCSSGTGG